MYDPIKVAHETNAHKHANTKGSATDTQQLAVVTENDANFLQKSRRNTTITNESPPRQG